MARLSYLTSNPAASDMTLRLISGGAVLRSSLTAAVQTIHREGYWTLEASWRNLTNTDFNDVVGFFLSLNGVTDRVVMPVQGYQAAGIGGGSAVVDGASQTGNTLSVRSAPLSTTGWLARGDMLAFMADSKRRLHRVTASVDTDGAGDASIPIEPALRASPADAEAIDYTGLVSGDFILVSDVEQSWSALRYTANNVVYGDFSVSLVEDV